MKKIMSIILLAGAFISIKAQYYNPDPNVRDEDFMLNLHPYIDVLHYIGMPDTILICEYVLRYYEEDPMPDAVCLFLYKRNGMWWGAHLNQYPSYPWTKKRTLWELYTPLWVQTNLSQKMTDAIGELAAYDDGPSHFQSSIHTWVYVKYGDIILQKWIIGNLRDYANSDCIHSMPAFSYVLTIGLLESYNHELIKSFNLKQYHTVR